MKSMKIVFLLVALAACAYAMPADNASAKQDANVQTDAKPDVVVAQPDATDKKDQTTTTTTTTPKPVETDKKEGTTTTTPKPVETDKKEGTTTSTTVAPDNKKPAEEATTPKPSGPATKDEIQEIITAGLADVNSKVKSTLVVASIVLVAIILTVFGLYMYRRRH